MKRKHARAIEKIVDERLERASNQALDESERKASLNDALSVIERTDALKKETQLSAIKTIDTAVGVAGAVTGAAGIYVKLRELRDNGEMKKLEMAFQARMTDAVMRFEETNIAGSLIAKRWLDLVTKFR